MKVYVVCDGVPWEGLEVRGVFQSLSDAENMVHKIHPKYKPTKPHWEHNNRIIHYYEEHPQGEWCEIQEWEVLSESN